MDQVFVFLNIYEFLISFVFMCGLVGASLILMPGEFPC